MDSRESKKIRSIEIEAKNSRPRPGPGSASARPQLGDRTHSDPTIVRHRANETQSRGQGQAQRKRDVSVSEVHVSEVRISDVIDRDSQVSIRQDPLSVLVESPHSTRLTAESSTAHGVFHLTEDVGSPLKANAILCHMLKWHLACYPGARMLTV